MLNVQPLSQNDPQWKGQKLGFGTGSIGNYGCLLTSFTAILNYFAKQNWSPEEINDLMKQWGGYAGETKNLWSWKVAEKFGIKYSLNHSDSYDDTEVKNWIAKGVPVILKVDGKPLGGLSHYIVALGDGKVMDSWDGTIKPFSSYTPLGYHVYTYEGKPTMSPPQSALQTYLGVDSDATAKNRLKDHLGEVDDKCDWGNEGDYKNPDEKRGGYLGLERRKIKSLEIKIKELAGISDRKDGEIEGLVSELTTVSHSLDLALEDTYEYATEVFLYQDILLEAQKIKDKDYSLVDPTTLGSSKLLMLTITAFAKENVTAIKNLLEKLKG